MPIRVRALILAAMVFAMNVVAMTAVAQAQRPDGAAQQQPTTADPTQQELAERWNTDYYQATHMSPAQHKAWLQTHKNSRSATQITTQVPPAQATGHPGRHVAALTVLATLLALVAGLAMLTVRRATRRARVSQAS
jgi:hypothetical protein